MGASFDILKDHARNDVHLGVVLCARAWVISMAAGIIVGAANLGLLAIALNAVDAGPLSSTRLAEVSIAIAGWATFLGFALGTAWLMRRTRAFHLQHGFGLVAIHALVLLVALVVLSLVAAGGGDLLPFVSNPPTHQFGIAVSTLAVSFVMALPPVFITTTNQWNQSSRSWPILV